MSLTVETGATITFDRFWRWLKRHPHCILRAGTSDSFLFDQDDLHWYLDEDEDRVPTVQLLRGKALIGEIAIDTRDILFVQAMPDPNASEDGQHVFEAVGGGDEPYPLYHFLVAHGFEDEGAGHRGPVLKQ